MTSPELSGRLLVLIVDDSLTVRKELGALLSENGYLVAEAAGGEEALRLVETTRPAIVIVDKQMPNMDGLEFIRRLRLDPRCRDTRCVLLTGGDESGAELESLEGGADVFAKKSQGLDVVLSRVDALARDESAVWPAVEQGESHLLLVDDSETILQELAQQLETSGFSVELARSGEECLAALAKSTPDALVVDMLMPEISGIDVCMRVRDQPQFHRMPILVLTGHETPESMKESLDAGADDFVSKQAGMLVLVARLRALLRRSYLEKSKHTMLERIAQADMEAELQRQARDAAEERARTADALQAKNLELKKLASELELARRLAEQASLAKGEFLANMSHEIRTPLNAVLGMLELLQASDLAPNQREMVDVAASGGSLLLALISDVLDISKIEAGLLEVERSPVAYQGGVRSLVKLFSARADEKNITLEVRLDEGVPKWVEGDASRINQIVSNLLSNAIKFTDRGRVVLSVEHDVAAQSLCLVVADTGPGIPADMLDAVFDKFRQTTTGKKAGGTGLGLAISRELANLMGGSLTVQSEVGQGAEFRLRLRVEAPPVGEDSPAPGASSLVPNPVERPSSEGRVSLVATSVHALVVDDQPANLRVVELMLSGLGHTCVCVQSGSEGLKYLRDEACDIVFLDCQMPEMDGFEVACHIRDGLGLGQLPVIALTADVTPPAREKAAKAGMNDFITKPVQSQELKRMVQIWTPGGAPRVAAFAAPSGQHARPSGTPEVLEPAGESAPAPAVDWERLGTFATLLQSKGPTALRSLIEGVLRELARMVSGIVQQSAADPLEWDALRAGAHTVKGTAGSYGAEAMKVLAEKLEAHVGEPTREAGVVRGIASDLKATLEDFDQAVRAWLDEQEASSADPTD